VWWPKNSPGPDKSSPGIVVVGFQAPLFFLNAETFHRTVSATVQSAPQPIHAVVLEASSIVEIDFSGAQTLLSMIEKWKTHGVTFYIARLESVRAQKALEKFGILQQMGEQKIFHSVSDAIGEIVQAHEKRYTDRN
jgi:MFS superfamily sulfate permease-like transporter